MFDKDKLRALLSDFLFSQMEGSFDKIILIKDKYFCIPKNLTNETLLLEGYPNSPFYIISHQSPVKRETIKRQQLKQFQTQNFIIAYNSADPNNDQFLDEMKQYNMHFELTPIKLINLWVGNIQNLDDSLNFLSTFIWDLKDFITTNRDKILRVCSLNNNIKFNRVVEIILKNNFPSLIEKGKIINLMNEKNSWKLLLIFQESTYIYRKIFKIFKEKIGIDVELINYMKDLVLNEVEFKEILKIFLVAHFLDKLGENFATGINFSSFINKFSEVHDADKKDLITSLNRTQIVVLSKIFENYLHNTKSKEKLRPILSLIKLLGDVIVNNSNLKEITLGTLFLRDLNDYEKTLKLSKIEYFYYLPLKISELHHKFFENRINDLTRSLSSDDGGRTRKIYDNIRSGNLSKVFGGIDDNHQRIVNFYKYFYKLCNGLFDIAYFNGMGFNNWDFRKWSRFYADFYIKFIENLDAISKLNIQYNYYTKECNEIIKWFTSKFSELEFEVSKKFFEFIKLKYPFWVINFRNPRSSPLLTANVFGRFINETFSRPLNNNFIILNDGCTLDNWRVLKRCIKSDFRDFCFEEKIGFSIIPSKTHWSRKAIFNADLMRRYEYFGGESTSFLKLLERMRNIRKNPGNHNIFFNTECEKQTKSDKVEQNIETDSDLTQIIIFNFSDVLNEASIDRVDVKDIIKNTYYPKIKKLLQLILRKHPNPNLFFITDHGITETKEKIRNIIIKEISGRREYNLDNVPKEICKKSPRLLQLHPDFTLDFNKISDLESRKFLFIDDYNNYGLIGRDYDKMAVAYSYYTFTRSGKAHGGITMAEMIIPFARMIKKPIVSRTDFEQLKILIENKEEYETTSNYLKISISNNNSEVITDLKLHLITTNTHQVKEISRIEANSDKKVSIYSDDKGIEPMLVKLDYFYRYNKFTTKFEFTLSFEDYSEELESELDDLVDEFF